MRKCVDWDPYYEIARSERTYAEKLDAYAAIAEERLETARFEEFCSKHLSHLDEIAWEFFGTERAKTIVREKTAALFPAHEVEKFTDHFFGLIQFWRKTEADRLNLSTPEQAP